MKQILPSLKEKKRYLAFRIISKSKIKAFSSISKAVWNATLSLAGDVGAAEMGVQVLPEKFKEDKGIIRVNASHVEELKAALALIEELEGNPALVQSLGASGMLNKAEKNYIAG